MNWYSHLGDSMQINESCWSLKWASVSVAVAVYPFLRKHHPLVSSGHRIWILKISQWEIDAHFTAPHVSRHGNHIAELQRSAVGKASERLNSTWYCLPLIMHAWLCWTLTLLGASRGDEEEVGGGLMQSQTFISAFLVCSWWWSFGGRRYLCCLIGRNETLE